MGSVRTILASLFTALGGLFLLVMTAGVGFALYIAAAPEGAPTPAEAEAVTQRPLLRAQSNISSRRDVIRIASLSYTPAFNAAAATSNHGNRVRQLQKALARAGCYEGPINGVWNNASRDAMRGFVRAANATLPVDAPDEALIALLESNEAASCAPASAIETGALGSTLQASAEQVHTQFVASKASITDAEPRNGDSAPTLLGKSWAPDGMLSRSIASPKSAEPPAQPASPAAKVTASNYPMPAVEPAATKQASTLHFEGGSPLPAVQDPSAERPVTQAGQEPPKPAAKVKKSRSVRRRSSQYEDVETTLSRGFDTLQRSLSSMF